MKIYPIIPIWLMLIVCVLLLAYMFYKKKININQILIIGLLFIINLRILIPSDNSNTLSTNLDVLFVIDSTISMVAEDYNGSNTRLSGVKNDCKYIAEKLGGARFSIVTFNNEARILIPFTKDVNMAIEAIETISPVRNLYARGSSLNTPLETIISQLEKSQEKDDRARVIFFVSDGEITDESTLESYTEVSNYLNGGAVLGYGTTQGGYMREEDSLTDGVYNYMENYESGKGYVKSVSTIDEDNLKKIASDMDVSYIHMEKQSDVDKVVSKIKSNLDYGFEIGNMGSYTDIYYIFVIPLLILLVIEFNKVRRSMV